MLRSALLAAGARRGALKIISSGPQGLGQLAATPWGASRGPFGCGIFARALLKQPGPKAGANLCPVVPGCGLGATLSASRVFSTAADPDVMLVTVKRGLLFRTAVVVTSAGILAPAVMIGGLVRLWTRPQAPFTFGSTIFVFLFGGVVWSMNKDFSVPILSSSLDLIATSAICIRPCPHCWWIVCHFRGVPGPTSSPSAALDGCGNWSFDRLSRSAFVEFIGF